MLKKIVTMLPILFISGCGLAQHIQMNEQRKAETSQAILSQPGMQAFRFLVEDDAVTAKEGGESLCENGCTVQEVINKINKSPQAITAFYLSVHDYKSPPNLYKSDDYIERNYILAEILNNVNSTLGSSSLNDESYIENGYKSFLKEYSTLGLKFLTKEEFNNASKELYKNRSKFVLEIAAARQAALQKASDRRTQKDIEFNRDNPLITFNTDMAVADASNNPKIRDAFKKMTFSTRKTNNQSASSVFIEGLSIQLTLDRMLKYVKNDIYQCKRVAAYADMDIERLCENQLGHNISEFADMVNNTNTPDKTKIAAISEATIGGYLDFGYAARLANMHNNLCKQQGDKGYVTMVTIAAPCKGFKGAGIE